MTLQFFLYLNAQTQRRKGLKPVHDSSQFAQGEPVPIVELEFAVVNNGYQPLGDYLQPGFSELMDKTNAVHALEKPWPQF